MVRTGAGHLASDGYVGYFAKMLLSKAVLRVSIQYTARPSFTASSVLARALLCCFSIRSAKALASGDSRLSNVMASEKAHFRCGLPILASPSAARLPSLVCCGVTNAWWFVGVDAAHKRWS